MGHASPSQVLGTADRVHTRAIRWQGFAVDHEWRLSAIRGGSPHLHRGGICHGRSAHHYGHATTPLPTYSHRLAPRASRLPRYHRAELHADVPDGAGRITNFSAAS